MGFRRFVLALTFAASAAIAAEPPVTQTTASAPDATLTAEKSASTPKSGKIIGAL